MELSNFIYMLLFYQLHVMHLYIIDTSHADCILIECGSPHALRLSTYDGRGDSNSLRTQV